CRLPKRATEFCHCRSLMLLIEHPEDLETFKSCLLAKRSDDIKDPILKRFCFWLPTFEYKPVYRLLIDDVRFLFSPQSIDDLTSSNPIFKTTERSGYLL